ncbi:MULTISPECIES: hypothetical protein [unclassified Coleofasciculus]|uniref:hypothetical protein n=1 Tax=unclassified Coleofasciculus TaxID=2692782 RepID=UPI00187EBEDE|nr:MULTISPECIES: hypothetical protein [unclassified Coleofasciculus]MBE9126969.1 hypothetical protein [Coleofasciculus sp. LEGE 07081]MBE9150348.1 hypothetical protein [Coleofasciculus sp. LEGE 07092]
MRFNFIGGSAALGIVTLLIFGILQWLHISAGHFLDWVIGVASFWWLLVVVTVPWNIHFEAKAVLADAAQSTEKGIEVDAKQVNYAQVIARRSLLVAIALHLFSTIGLYTLAATGISAVGYISSGAALLLTALRPAVRLYEYLAVRLAAIRQEFKYPRQDIQELCTRVNILETNIKQVQEQLDPQEPYSWVTTQQRYWEETRKDLARLGASFEQLQATNEAEHQRLAREAQQAIAQLTVDSQFLDHVREIIRFFKAA